MGQVTHLIGRGIMFFIVLWLLGVPIGLIVLLWLLGIFS